MIRVEMLLIHRRLLAFRRVLRDELMMSPRHAVIVSPAIDGGQFITPVAVSRRCIGGLPLQRGGAPGVRLRLLTLGEAPNHIDEEQNLRGPHEQGGIGDGGVGVLRHRPEEVGLPQGVVTARHTQEAEIVHGQIDGVSAEEGEPEMHLGHALVIHPAGDLGIPVIDGGEQHQHRRHPHHHVEVSHHEVGVGKGQVDHHIAEEQPGQPAVDEGEDEADGEEHRRVEADVPLPQGQHPVIHLQRRRHGDDQRGGGEEETEVGVHPAHIHVVGPNDEAQPADGDDGPHHHPIAEDVLAGVNRQHIRHQPERRQRHDVNLRMAEEPEQMLEQNRRAAVVIQRHAGLYHRRHEERGAQQGVEQHHNGRHQQGREGEQTQHGGHEDAPHAQGQPHHGQAAAAVLQHGDHIVQAPHGEGHDEHRQGNQHQHDAHIMARRSGHGGLGRIEGPACPGRPAADEETGQQNQHRQQIDPVTEHIHEREHHIPRPAHKGDQIIAEAAEEQRREQVDHHDHPVHGHGLIVETGVDEVHRVREAQLQAHAQ